MSNATEADTKLELYRQVVSILEGLGHESSLDEEYSGRCMYGKTVPAIVTDAPAPLIGWAICMALAENDEFCAEWPADSISDAQKLVPARSDSMGLSAVYY